MIRSSVVGSVLLGISLVSLLSGCAPGLGTRIAPPVTIAVESGGIVSREPVLLSPWRDERSDAAFVTIKDRAVSADGDISAVVRAGFEDGWRAGGGVVSAGANVRLAGRIIRWSGIVTPEFPASRMTVVAAIAIDVLDAKGAVIGTRTFEGELSALHPYFTEQRTQELLAEGMGYALRAAIGDETLRTLIERAAAR